MSHPALRTSAFDRQNGEPDRWGTFVFEGIQKTQKNSRHYHGIVSSLGIVFDLQQSRYRNTLARPGRAAFFCC